MTQTWHKVIFINLANVFEKGKGHISANCEPFHECDPYMILLLCLKAYFFVNSVL